MLQEKICKKTGWKRIWMHAVGRKWWDNCREILLAGRKWRKTVRKINVVKIL
jgi:hypothetical protein